MTKSRLVQLIYSNLTFNDNGAYAGGINDAADAILKEIGAAPVASKHCECIGRIAVHVENHRMICDACDKPIVINF